MNLCWGGEAGYVVTGSWSEKALFEGKKYCQPAVIADAKNYSPDGLYNDIAHYNDWDLHQEKKLGYIHFCSNETIQGVQYAKIPDMANNEIPLVCDMSSDILSREIPIKNFGIIYAGAQKNLGIAGVTIVIIRKDLLENGNVSSKEIPSILHYKNVCEKNSLINTPCTYAIYFCNRVLHWIDSLGGIAEIGKMNNEKASLLYDYLDSESFYPTRVAKQARSKMNVVFDLKQPDLLNKFLESSNAYGLYQLKGHRNQGGIRASIYNAMPKSGVIRLIEFLSKFAKQYA